MLLLLLLDPLCATLFSVQVLQALTNYRSRILEKEFQEILKRACRRRLRVAGWVAVAVVRWQRTRAVQAMSEPMQLPASMDIDPNETAGLLDMAFEQYTQGSA